MIITIDKSIFDQYGTPSVDKDIFGKVLHTAKYRYHSVSLSQSCGMEEISNVDSNDAFFLQALFTEYINAKPEVHKSDCLVKVGGEKENVNKIFSLDETYEYINSPAEIIVEHATNDGRFIRAIEENFDPSLEFEKLRSENIVHIDGASGSGDRSRIEDYLVTHHQKVKFLHCCVIVDGDKRHPNDDRKLKQHEKRIKLYKRLGVPYHVWEKRSMENYMPDEVFEKNRQKWGKLWVDAFRSLSPIQRDYYDISGGFSKDLGPDQPQNHTGLPSGMNTLFNRVSLENFKRLIQSPSIKPYDGIPTPDIIEELRSNSMKNCFPTYFLDSNLVRYDTLMTRTSHQEDPDELIHVAQMIRQII
ncbi:MAG: hypothetical protein J6X88_00065 [Bacteroidales bacterium]|nr:hypothetical protein [Bacteroidales bacterium]